MSQMNSNYTSNPCLFSIYTNKTVKQPKILNRCLNKEPNTITATAQREKKVSSNSQHFLGGCINDTTILYVKQMKYDKKKNLRSLTPKVSSRQHTPYERISLIRVSYRLDEKFIIRFWPCDKRSLQCSMNVRSE